MQIPRPAGNFHDHFHISDRLTLIVQWLFRLVFVLINSAIDCRIFNQLADLSSSSACLMSTQAGDVIEPLSSSFSLSIPPSWLLRLFSSGTAHPYNYTFSIPFMNSQKESQRQDKTHDLWMNLPCSRKISSMAQWLGVTWFTFKVHKIIGAIPHLELSASFARCAVTVNFLQYYYSLAHFVRSYRCDFNPQ
jgi:hypothetical protein